MAAPMRYFSSILCRSRYNSLYSYKTRYFNRSLSSRTAGTGPEPHLSSATDNCKERKDDFFGIENYESNNINSKLVRKGPDLDIKYGDLLHRQPKANEE